MSTSNPSSFLTESLASLSKSVYRAFTEVENQSRADVAAAISDAREARRERDEAVKLLNVCQLEGQAWKQEVAACQASLKQAEVTIEHQAETLSQLRREATQWKEQSQNWQEHFLRVEQERCALSARLEELFSEQLALNRPPAGAALFTPKLKYSHIIEPAFSSTTTKRASTSSSKQTPTYSSAHRPCSPERESPLDNLTTQKRTRPGLTSSKPTTHRRVERESPLSDQHAASSGSKQNTHAKIVKSQNSVARSSTKTQRLPAMGGTAQSESRQTLIRRVQAVVRLPIKQEDMEENVFKTSVSDSRVGGDNTIMMARRRSTRRSKAVQDDEDSSAEDYINGRDDEKQDNECIMTPSEEEPENEEDDELMMGAEDNRDEVYGTERVVSSSHRRPNKIPTTVPNSANKRRRLGGCEKVPVKRRC